MDSQHCVAVVGSGLFGALAVKELTGAGLTVHWYSADEQVGGIWLEQPLGKVRASTELVNPGWCISPRFLRRPTVGAADFRSELQSWAELRRERQVRHFGTRVSEVSGDGEEVVVTLADGTTRRHGFVVVATGHYGRARIPFAHSGAKVVHASEVGDVSELPVGHRVLVVGGGQSGVEICEELIAGAPGVHLTWSTAGRLRLLSRFSLLGMAGTCLRYRTGEAAPRGFTITKDPARVRERCVMLPQRVASVVDSTVTFEDGQVGVFDLVIAATGYEAPEAVTGVVFSRGPAKGLSVGAGGRVVSMNHYGDGCGGASVTCARREARQVARLAVAATRR